MLAPELRGELGVIHDDDLAQARLGDDLLAEERSPAALDEVEVGVDLVGAVDREIDDGMLGQRRERDADLPRELRARARRRDAEHVLQVPRLHEHADAADREQRRAPRAEADDHPGAHEVRGALAGRLLEIVAVGHGLVTIGSCQPPNASIMRSASLGPQLPRG